MIKEDILRNGISDFAKFNYLRNFIDSEVDKERIEAINLISKLNLNQINESYAFLENLCISDDNNELRAIAIKIVLEQFYDKSEFLIDCLLENIKSHKVFLTIYDLSRINYDFYYNKFLKKFNLEFILKIYLTNKWKRYNTPQLMIDFELKQFFKERDLRKIVRKYIKLKFLYYRSKYCHKSSFRLYLLILELRINELFELGEGYDLGDIWIPSLEIGFESIDVKNLKKDVEKLILKDKKRIFELND